MAIREKELARVKTSGEDVMVLEILDDGGVVVRRPTGTQDGVKHVIETFYFFELETPDEARTRAMAEQFSMQQKFASLSSKDEGGQGGN